MFASSPFAGTPYAAPTGGGGTVAIIGLAGIVTSESWPAAAVSASAGLATAPIATTETAGPVTTAAAAGVAIAAGPIPSAEAWGTFAVTTGDIPGCLEAAIKAWLLAFRPALVAQFGGINNVVAGRRPSKGPTTYLRLETPSSFPGLFTGDSVVHHTRLVLTVYTPDRESARALGDAVDTAFTGSRWDYRSARGPVATAPLTPANRSQAEEPMLGRDGTPVFYDRLEYLCREQKAR